MTPLETGLRLTTTFGTMGVWVTFIAVATTRWGGEIGGFLIGIPSTVGLSFFFTGLYVSTATAVQATNDLPMFLSFIGLFLLAYGYLAKGGFAVGVIGSLMIWLVASLLAFYSRLSGFWTSLTVGLVIFFAAYYVFREKLKPVSTGGGGSSKGTSWTSIFRFLFGGAVVTTAVYFGQIGIPVLSAMAASFPALSLSAIVAIQLDGEPGGTARTRGLTMPATVSVMILLVPFGVCVHFLYPALGVIYGTASGYVIIGAIGVLYYLYGRKILVPSFV